MEEPKFRAMQLEDIEQILEIEHESFTTPWTAEAFYSELIYNQFAHYLVMELDGIIVGYGGMWLIMDEAHITNIAIREKYRGRKLGVRLMSRLQQYALELNMRKMTLEVRVSNIVAQQLYAKFRFRSVGVRKGYYTDNNEDAVIMWADLKPNVNRYK